MADQKYTLAPRVVQKSVAATTVPGSSTKIGSMDVRGLRRIFVQLTVATASLTGFAIKVQATPAAAEQTLYSAAADFTTPAGLLVGASGDLTGAAAGAHWFCMDVSGLELVHIYATSGGTATLAIEAGGT